MEKTIAIASDPVFPKSEFGIAGIPFTQHLIPPLEGTRPMWIERPQGIERKAANAIAEGCSFHTGHMGLGVIWLESRFGEAVILRKQCFNGPEVLKCVDEVIEAAGKGEVA